MTNWQKLLFGSKKQTCPNDCIFSVIFCEALVSFAKWRLLPTQEAALSVVLNWLRLLLFTEGAVRFLHRPKVRAVQHACPVRQTGASPPADLRLFKLSWVMLHAACMLTSWTPCKFKCSCFAESFSGSNYLPPFTSICNCHISARHFYQRHTFFFFFLPIVIHHSPPQSHTSPGSARVCRRCSNKYMVWCSSNYACIVFRATNHTRILCLNCQRRRSLLGSFTFISSTSFFFLRDPLDPLSQRCRGQVRGSVNNDLQGITSSDPEKRDVLIFTLRSKQ